MANEKKSAAPKAPQGAEAASTEATHVMVRAHAAGFRRAGRAWPAEDVTVPIGEFTKEQLLALVAEPLLSVILVKID